MKLLINIDEESYNYAKKCTYNQIMITRETIANGKPLEQEPTTKNDLGVDCISRADALRVAKNEYLRGWHNALCKALSEKYSIHCEEGNFSVIQEETITGLGLSMNCALGKDVESYMSTMPSVTPIRPKGHWIYDYTSADGHRTYHCSECGCYLHPKHSEPLNSFKWCSLCGADMREVGE